MQKRTVLLLWLILTHYLAFLASTVILWFQYFFLNSWNTCNLYLLLAISHTHFPSALEGSIFRQGSLIFLCLELSPVPVATSPTRTYTLTFPSLSIQPWRSQEPPRLVFPYYSILPIVSKKECATLNQVQAIDESCQMAVPSLNILFRNNWIKERNGIASI